VSNIKFVDAPIIEGDAPYVETTEFQNGRVRVKLFFTTEGRPRNGVVTQTSREVDFTLTASELACVAETLLESVADSRTKVVQAAEARVDRLAEVASRNRS